MLDILCLVSDCCTPKGYSQVFSERGARSQARSYRRNGLDATSRRIVELLKQQGVDGLTLLEVGGGSVAIQIELKAGLARAVSVELRPLMRRPPKSSYVRLASRIASNGA